MVTYFHFSSTRIIQEVQCLSLISYIFNFKNMIKRIHSTSSTMTKLGKSFCPFLKVLLLSILIFYYVLDHPKMPMVKAQRQLYNCIHILMVSLNLHFFQDVTSASH